MDGTEYLQLFLVSSPIIKGVYLTLLFMSLASWSIIFLKLLQYRKVEKTILADTDVLRGSGSLRTLSQKLGQGEDAVTAAVARYASTEYDELIMLQCTHQEQARSILEQLRHGLGDEVESLVHGLGRKLPFLSVCASTAPLMGLFGTVWGIFHSFQGFSSMTKAASFQIVGQGLGEALGTTIAGLLVAIPATLFYNMLLSRLVSIERSIGLFASLLLRLAKNDLLLRNGSSCSESPEESHGAASAATSRMSRL
jgi:biopolymer transport protein TolQ